VLTKTQMSTNYQLMISIKDTLTYKIHSIAIALDAEANDLIKKNSNITYPLYLGLLGVYILENPNQKELANWLNITSASANYLVKKLAILNLITSKSQTKDKRNLTLSITKNGKQLTEHLFELHEKQFSQKIKSISRDKLAQLSAILDEIKTEL
jgi:DNA-binding MarR family transcriptional regulator